MAHRDGMPSEETPRPLGLRNALRTSTGGVSTPYGQTPSQTVPASPLQNPTQESNRLTLAESGDFQKLRRSQETAAPERLGPFLFAESPQARHAGRGADEEEPRRCRRNTRRQLGGAWLFRSASNSATPQRRQPSQARWRPGPREPVRRSRPRRSAEHPQATALPIAHRNEGERARGL